MWKAFTAGGKSLFFPQAPRPSRAFSFAPESQRGKKIPSLEGVFYREDLGTWIVWINGERIDSESAVTADGWRVVHVSEKEVVIQDSSTNRSLTFHVLDTLSSKGKSEPTPTPPPEESPQTKE